MTDAEARACFEAFRARHPTSPAPADYSPEEFEFLKAVHRYQRVNRRRFPTFAEILAIAVALGYRK